MCRALGECSQASPQCGAARREGEVEQAGYICFVRLGFFLLLHP